MSHPTRTLHLAALAALDAVKAALAAFLAEEAAAQGGETKESVSVPDSNMKHDKNFQLSEAHIPSTQAPSVLAATLLFLVLLWRGL